MMSEFSFLGVLSRELFTICCALHVSLLASYIIRDESYHL